MKRIILHLFMLLCISVQVFAQDFEAVNSDGKTIYYNITSSTTPRTVEVTHQSSYSDEYAGEINIPSSVTYNGNTYSVTSIGYDAFGFCKNLTGIIIPNSVTIIDDFAFYRCSGLTSVTIGSGVTSIGDFAFDTCNNIQTLNWNVKNCTVEGYNAAFTGKRSIISLTIGDSVQVIPAAAFCDCIGLTNVTIGNNVTSIGSSTFRNCSGLTSITIPNSVTSIGEEAFEFCIGLTDIVIPNSVTSIGYKAFYVCNRLTSVTIGNNVSFIADSAFGYCAIDTLRMKSENPPTIGENVFDIDTLNVIYVPCDSEDVYKSATGWSAYENYIQEDCSAIEDVVEEETSIAVYPNPVMDNAVLSIENLKEDVKVILTDEQGRQVSLSTMKAGENTLTLETTSLSSGIYFVRIIGETIQRTEKLIKR